MIKNTVAIVFNAGSYGTYLEWCLTTLTSRSPIQEPFNSNGNSHQFAGHHLFNMSGWRYYVKSTKTYDFVRLHPKSTATDSLTSDLLEIAQNANKVLHVYPDDSSILLNINNLFYKVWESWIDQWFIKEIDLNKIYSNWPVSKDTPVQNIPNWIMREFLSYYLMPAWMDKVEWNHPLTFEHPNVMIVTISQLLFDFCNTLSKIQQFCNLDYQHPIDHLLPIHERNLQLQKYKDHDRICVDIINSVIGQTDLVWSELSLPSEAWLQWKLRELGYELRCDGLDKFPTNSLHLKELLYSV